MLETDELFNFHKNYKRQGLETIQEEDHSADGLNHSKEELKMVQIKEPGRRT